MINRVLFFLFTIICSLSANQTIRDDILMRPPQEEHFRYCNDLAFKLPDGYYYTVDNQSINSINFNDVHDHLRNFEERCTNDYLSTINEQTKNTCDIEIDMEEVDKIKRKNIAVFAVTLLLSKEEAYGKKEIRYETVPEKTKIFISGVNQPLITKYKRNEQGERYAYAKTVISFLCNEPVIAVCSLQESTRPAQESTPSVSCSSCIKRDLYPSYKDRKVTQNTKQYTGIFAREDRNGRVSNYSSLAYRDIVTQIYDIFYSYRKDDYLFKQWNTTTWGGSLADSEQSLRIYFQNHCESILEELKDIAEPELLKSRSDKKSEEVLGVMLHIHSRMDVCELCNASLMQMMSVCNKHYCAPRGAIDGYSSFLNDHIFKAFKKFNVPMSKEDFRFRITVSSREPYVKRADVWRRNWCGASPMQKQVLAPPSPETINFKDESYIPHKAYS